MMILLVAIAIIALVVWVVLWTLAMCRAASKPTPKQEER